MTNMPQWPLNLIKNEYCKDNGIRGERLTQLLKFIPLGRNTSGNYLYEVTNSGKTPSVETWELERRSLSFITSKSLFITAKEANHFSQLVSFISKNTGHHLIAEDIESVSFHKTHWVVKVSENSLRYFGSFTLYKI